MPAEDDFHYQPEPGRAAVDPAMRRIVLGAGGAACLVIAVALAWGGYRAGGFGPPPEIAPPPGPLRVTPADPGGLTVPGANMPIMSGAAATAPAQLAPAPAAPAVAQLDQDAGIPLPPAPPAMVLLGSAPDALGAETLWGGLAQKYAAQLAGKTPDFLPALSADGAKIWAVEVGGFATPAAAQAFCAPLLAAAATCRVLP